MNFLPVVTRELQAQSRQWQTYWVRAIMGFIGTLLCMLQLGFGDWFGTAASAELGRIAFRGLVWLGFILCCFGCLATSDAISWERREKTLGLLFLTRIRSFDILLGKLVSRGLVVLCALAALLPILMLPVLAGGVSGWEAVRIGLMMIDTLILSLVVGLFASARHVQWHKAVRAAVGTMVLVLVLPVIAQLIFHPLPVAGLFSPLYGVTLAKQSGLAFWMSLIMVQWVVWFLFWRAMKRVRLALNDAEGETASAAELNRTNIPPRVVTLIRPLHRVGEQPVGWLLNRQRGIHAMIMGGVICSVFFYGFRLSLPMFMGIAGAGSLAAWPVAFLGTVVSGGLFAWAASRFLFEARKSGELEVLITTPVGAKTVVQDQWLYLRRAFKVPLVVMMMPLLFQIVAVLMTYSERVAVRGNDWVMAYWFSMALSVVNLFLSVLAICWAGMWFGLKARSQAGAVFQTVMWVKALPYVASYLWMLLTRALWYDSSNPYAPRFILSLLPQVALVFFYWWLICAMRRQLFGEVRDAETFSLSFRADFTTGWRRFIAMLTRLRHQTPS